MIELRSPMEIQADPQGGWQLVFWVLDAFDYDTPFRTMLADIADALGQNATTDVELPAYERNEDFVEGVMQFGAVPLRIYYEHSLSFLAFMSGDEAVLREAAARIQPYVNLVP